MSIDVLILGTMRVPVHLKTSADKLRPYITFKVFAVDKRGTRVALNCVSYSQSVLRKIENLQEGDSVALSGSAALTTWIDPEGTERQGLDLTVHAAMTAYHVVRHRSGEASEGQQGEGIGKTGH